jgi:hypothetical protein
MGGAVEQLAERGYWTERFTLETWREFLDAGGDVSGFREGSCALVQRLQPGDYLLCYLVGVSRWCGVWARS